MALFQKTYHMEGHWKFRGGGGEGGLKDQTFLEEVQKLHWYSRPVGLK